ncbi:hypothetical protein NIES2119_21560 [[Phormidium ambiguum] IAM M-71]|uniref:Uncharacterized protein n=1 Tax=[Phormidium ambiguum] IAM M-71 TaxID=454136 RepID=A0A1U7IBQ6_9CYAN|nr:hypothetical protein [Phormidium ambiguum]OKH34090.1 hypothetical protein NIES2119_21560 [Phormidium ambiguum IAM M-71]
MLPTSTLEWQSFTNISSLKISESKIVHKSPTLHPLARFVTEEAAAILFNISLEEIYKITCLRYVVHVHGKGISRFVSYADFPPILAVNLPTPLDFYFWHKRWKKKPAQEFWQKFYIYQFEKALSAAELLEWNNLVTKVKSLFTNRGLETIKDAFSKQQNSLNFSGI